MYRAAYWYMDTQYNIPVTYEPSYSFETLEEAADKAKTFSLGDNTLIALAYEQHNIYNRVVFIKGNEQKTGLF